jgi:cytochrome d ubiquinol oxidase subunit I
MLPAMDEALVLARAQFGLNIGFHILFPSITIGLGWMLFVFRLLYERTHDHAWLATYRLWVKVFALCFAMGVVTGVVMSFQFGTNWPGFMNSVGNIAGPLLAYEVLTAFFLEATFLGVMLFGMDRVSGWVHVLSTFVVAFGTTLSAFWILALNSWMQTPTGHITQGTVLIAGSWIDVIFNPSFPYRFAHMLLASGLTAAFLVAGLSAWRLLRAPQDSGALATLRLSVLTAAVLVPLQIVAGDLHGLNTLKHQPEKIAALEAIWQTESGVPLTLIGIPNEETKRTDYALKVPRAGSLILAHDANAEIKGLEAIEVHPPVAPLFFAFRIMVGIGVLMLTLSWFGAWQLFRKKAFSRPLLWAFAAFTFSGWVGVLAGWIVTEMGRQPWLVTGLLRTAEAVGDVPGTKLGMSFTAYVITYGALLLSFMVVITHLAGKGEEKAGTAKGDLK